MSNASNIEASRLQLEKRNQRQAAALSVMMFVLVVVACFFLTAFTIQDPPPGEQFVAVGFADLGDVEEAGGTTESEAPSEVIQEAEEEAVAASEPKPEVPEASEEVETQESSEMSVNVDKDPDPDPDPDFYSQKFSDAINTKQPVIVFFISPNFCKTATCFPQLDVIKRLKHVYDDKIIYIHVEVYENPHLIKGNLQNAKISDVLNEWNIKSEPYTFLIKNKKLVSKFQGYVSYEEIDNDIDKILDVN